jgi:DNA-binding NarL/FixJ family response regulator
VSAPRVLVAEADLLTRTGLRVTLAGAGFEVVAEAGDADDAVARARAESPDLVLVAGDLPGGGLAAVARIAAEDAAARIVVLTRRPDGDELVAAVQAGAAGYIVAEGGQERLPHALRGVLEGEVALPRRHTQTLLDALRGRDARRASLTARSGARLTDREWEVLELVGAGTSSAEIARRLGISEVTVRRHASSAVAKLGLPNRAAAVRALRERSGR